MTVRTTKNGEIVTTTPDQAKKDEDRMVGLIRSMEPAIKKALPKHLTAERMINVSLVAMRTNPALAECDSGSIVASVLQASQLGLELNTPLQHAALIPYKGRCTLQVMFQGMVELSYRSGYLAKIWTGVVHEGDEFRPQEGMAPDLVHVHSLDPDREDQPILFVYACAKLKNGETLFRYLSTKKVEQHRARSRAKSDGPWVTDWEEMARKTAIRVLWKLLPKSPEMAVAAEVVEDRDDRPVYRPEIQQQVERAGFEVVSTVEEEPKQ